MGSRSSFSSRVTRQYGLSVIALATLALVIYLLGNNLFPLIDRDEPRYAQASRQMLESGDWITPRYLDQLRLKKPIFIYWLQASSMNWIGDTAFAARLPSVIASILTLLMFAIVWPRFVGVRRARWGLFIFATMLLPTYIAKVCMTDAVLHLFIACSMLCLYAIWIGAFRWWMTVPFGAAIGLSILTKGPPAFLFLGTTLIALFFLNWTTRPAEPRGSLRISRFVPNAFMGSVIVVGIIAALCVPWALHLEAAHPGALLNMLKKEAIDRATDPQEGHSGPPGYYFLTFWGTAFPWCLLWPAALWHGWKRRAIPWVRFCLAAILGPWVFLEIYQTKLPHYWLPSYPFMALLIGDTLVRAIRGRIRDYGDKPFLIAAGIACAIVSLIGLSFLAIPWLGDGPTIATYATSAIACVATVSVAWGVFVLLRRQQLSRAALVMGLGFWGVLTFMLSLFVPSAPAFSLSQRAGLYLRDIGATHDARMIGFKEPSLAFYQGGTIREQSRTALPDESDVTTSPRWIVIDEETLSTQPQAMQDRYRIRATFRGMSLADGKAQETVHVLEKNSGPATLPSGGR